METESPTRAQSLQVGDWTVDAALNQLSAPGKTVKLEALVRSYVLSRLLIRFSTSLATADSSALSVPRCSFGV